MHATEKQAPNPDATLKDRTYAAQRAMEDARRDFAPLAEACALEEQMRNLREYAAGLKEFGGTDEDRMSFFLGRVESAIESAYREGKRHGFWQGIQ